MLLSYITWYFIFLSSVWAISVEEAKDAPSLEFEVPENRFILEFETTYSDVQEDFDLQSLEFSVNNQFDSPAFLGMSIQVQNGSNCTLHQIQSLASVKNVWQASYVTLDFQTTPAVRLMWNPHIMSGVNTFHDRNIFGEGIRIAVVDSGLDVNHEVFKNKSIEGYDFTKDAQSPLNTFVDDVGHGTFVSSVIVGESENLRGVAPQASLKMYKVFGKTGSTTDDVILAALLKAYSENPDVISLSLGSDRGYPSMPISIVASKISETIPIVFAAGNSGVKGPFTASSGASGKGVIAVASAESTQHVSWSATLTSSSGKQLSFNYIGNNGARIARNEEYEVDFVGNACHIQTTSSSTRKVLMGIRGTCKNSQIATEIELHNYAGSIMFVSPAEMHVTNIRPRNGETFFGLTTNLVRNWIKREISNQASVTLSFDHETKHTAMGKTDGSGALINSFTSWGPTFDLDFYPHIVAPGGNIFGALSGGGYLISSGTSYACPYVAGIIALFLSENGRVDPETLRKKVIGSGKLLKQAYTSAYIDYSRTKVDDVRLAPLIQQGNGLVDAESLWKTNTSLLSAPYLLLNDTANREALHQILISNDGAYDVTYQFSHRALETVYTRDSKKKTVLNYWPELTDVYPDVRFSKLQLTLSPGERGSITVDIASPTSLDLRKAPIFQGEIDINGSNGDRITVPFIGMEFDAKDWTPFAEEPTLLVKDQTGLRRIGTNESFSSDGLRSLNLYYAIRFATVHCSIDVVDENYSIESFDYPPVEGKNGYHEPLQAYLPQSGKTLRYPISFSPISSRISYIQLQSFANGTIIPSGRYRLLCRALKTFGNPANPNDWQMYLTDAFLVHTSPAVPESPYDRRLDYQSRIKREESKNRIGSETILHRKDLRSNQFITAYLSVVPDVPYSVNTTLSQQVTKGKQSKSISSVQSLTRSINQVATFFPNLCFAFLGCFLAIIV